MPRHQRGLQAVLDIAGVAREVLGVVWPPESCPFDFIDTEEGPLREEYHVARRENRRWRYKVAGSLIAVAGVLVWLIFFSTRTTAEQVDQQIKAQVEPIKKEISDIKALVQQQTTANAQLTSAIIEQLAAREADNICRILRQSSKETDFDERRRFRNDADSAQERYKVYKKEYYPESRCQG